MIWATPGERRFDTHLALSSTAPTRVVYGWVRPRLRENLVGHDTALVLDGFPRSANSYAYAAFRRSNGPDIKVSHHVHAAGNIVWALRHRVPTVVLVRTPLYAVASFMQFQGVTARYGLMRYISFYRKVLRHRDGVVLAEFDEVIRGFGTTVRRVNGRFGTGFSEYVPTPENEEWCRGFVHEMHTRFVGHADPARLPLPSKSREADQDSRECRVRDEDLLLAQAMAVYRTIKSV